MRTRNRLSFFFVLFQVYDRALIDDLRNMLSKEFEKTFRLLEAFLTHPRDAPNDDVDDFDAQNKAAALQADNFPENCFKEGGFVNILVATNHNQLRKIFDEYSNLTKQTIQQTIKRSMHGEFAKALSGAGKYSYMRQITTDTNSLSFFFMNCSGFRCVTRRIFRKTPKSCSKGSWN